MPAPKKPPAKPARPATSYVILRSAPAVKDEAARWVELGSIEAHSDKQAIRAYVEANPADAAERETYVAVPARSFKLHVVERQVQTRLKIG